MSDNPFRVPEGYFDNLTNQVMARIDESQRPVEMKQTAKRAKQYRIGRIAIAAAACLFGAFFCTSVLLHQPAQTQQVAATQIAVDNDTRFEQMADYLMVDTQDLYAYVAEN